MPTAEASGAPLERGAVAPGRHRAGDCAGRQHRAERETSPKTLGAGDNVGFDVSPFIGEELAGAPDAGLHLVEHQQQAVLVTELAQGSHGVKREHADAAITLHRLEQDGGGLGSDRRAHGIEIGEGNAIEARHHRLVALGELGLPAGGDRSHGATVEAVAEGDGAPAARC